MLLEIISFKSKLDKIVLSLYTLAILICFVGPHISKTVLNIHVEWFGGLFGACAFFCSGFYKVKVNRNEKESGTNWIWAAQYFGWGGLAVIAIIIRIITDYLKIQW